MPHMFGLSWGQIAIIVLVGVFVLGPERIPTAVTWVLTNVRKLRSMAAGAQAELRKEIGPELDELRRQVADLQSLKEIQELRDLRDLHPKRLIGKNILGDEFSGGITGFLGLNQPVAGAPDGSNAAESVSTAATNGISSSKNSGGDRSAANGAAGSGAAKVSEAGAVTPVASTALNGSGSAAGTYGNGVLNGHASNGPPSVSTGQGQAAGSTPPHLPPSMTKLAAPKVVGGVPQRVAARALDAGERPPFDPDGT
jgi:sec-independent protein translocase protein TatB